MAFELAIGIVGISFILAAFILDEFLKTWNQNTIRYNLFNIVGAAFLVWYAYLLNSWPFMVLNGVWFLAAMIKLYEILKK
ncbi:hypothetical protein COV20_00660 [Candidatus Woesearchaeota archaeon CG10_big_fil_rev_8_21_14_0_10_45_16]|nr:MAG: hypothetical protein COV20_00660 [Candidatus Woesearchaeota archaeon CG10_big_fil_rev_8_21_14_0_10_45_16]